MNHGSQSGGCHDRVFCDTFLFDEFTGLGIYAEQSRPHIYFIYISGLIMLDFGFILLS